MEQLIKTTGVKQFVTRIEAQVQKIEKSVNTGDAPEGWHNELVDLVDVSYQFSRAFDKIIGFVLLAIYRLWEEFPRTFKLQYSGNFYEFAFKHAELSKGTVDNYMSTARAFEDFDVFGMIEVPRRDNAGNPLVVDGMTAITYVEFDPLQVTPSKLAVCAPFARDGSLKGNTVLMSMLMDDGVTVEDLRYEVYGNKKNGFKKPTYFYSIEGLKIIAHLGEEQIEIAEIDWASLVESKIAREAMINMLSRLGIKFNIREAESLWKALDEEAA